MAIKVLLVEDDRALREALIRSALTHGVDGTLHGAVGGHQQHRQLRLARTQQAEQLVSVHARHVDVADLRP